MKPAGLTVIGNVDEMTKTSDAAVAQLAERVLGKDEVTGPIPVIGSRTELPNMSSVG